MKLLFIIVTIAVILTIIAGVWKIFTKAGRKGWEALIPVHNVVTLMEIAGKPGWWVFFIFVPIINTVIYIMLLHFLSKKFGHGIGFTLGLIFFPFIFCPILAFGPSQYAEGLEKEAKAEETKAEETKAEEAKADETKADETKVEEMKVEETKAEEMETKDVEAEKEKVIEDSSEKRVISTPLLRKKTLVAAAATTSVAATPEAPKVDETPEAPAESIDTTPSTEAKAPTKGKSLKPRLKPNAGAQVKPQTTNQSYANQSANSQITLNQALSDIDNEARAEVAKIVTEEAIEKGASEKVNNNAKATTSGVKAPMGKLKLSSLKSPKKEVKVEELTEVSAEVPTPKPEAPKPEAPKAEAPKAEAPKAEAPKAEVPKVDAPKTDAPKTEVPKADAPKTEVPKADAPKTDAPKAEAPKAEAPKAEVPKQEKKGGGISKKLLIIVILALIALIGIGVGGYMLISKDGSSSDNKAGETIENKIDATADETPEPTTESDEATTDESEAKSTDSATDSATDESVEPTEEVVAEQVEEATEIVEPTTQAAEAKVDEVATQATQATKQPSAPQPTTQPQKSSNTQPAQPIATIGKIQLAYGSYSGDIEGGKANGMGKMVYSQRVQISKFDSKKRYAEVGQYIIGSWYGNELEFGKLYNADGTLVETLMIGRAQ